MKRKNNPWVVLVIGLFGLGLFGWLGIRLFFMTGAHYTEHDLEIVQGNVESSGVLRRGKSGDVLQIWLKGQPLPFQAITISYPRCYRRDLVAALQPEVPVAVGILPAEKAKPYRSGISRQPFLNIYSLTVNGEVALSVDDYNRCAQKNDKVGRIVDPILLAISALLVIVSVRTIRRTRARV